MSTYATSRLRVTDRRALGATAIAFAILGGVAAIPILAPEPPSQALAEYSATYAQDFQMTAEHFATAQVVHATMQRDPYGATPGPSTFIAGGTNHDWAKLVLVYAGWPITESNVTVITRWMRQENYVDAWWTRNNPLNIGAGGFASYSSLQESARVVAKALTTSAGYRDIAAGFAASADPATIEYAIWASPWAGGHYAWGGHWHYNPVEVVTAPRSAWGG